MCGIYGIASNNSKTVVSPETFLKGLKIIGLSSQSRGKDSSGICIVNKNELRIYKGPVPVNQLLNSKQIKEDLRACSSLKKSCSIGHARLVTNGSQLDSNNNQPVQVGSIVGIHNGIVTNIDELWDNYPELDRRFEIDTEIIFAVINYKIINCDQSIESAVAQTMSEIEGTAAIAFMINGLNKIVLATNNGSLYKLYKKSEYFIFASEANILNALYKDKELSKLVMDSEIQPINADEGLVVDLESLTSTSFKFSDVLDFEGVTINQDCKKNVSCKEINPDSKQLSAVIDLNVIHLNENALKESGMLQYPVNKIQELKRCKKCILPETFPFISFDSMGVCNYCNNYKQKPSVTTFDEILEKVEPYRGSGNKPNVLVPLSGGRDSIYSLHIVKEELGLNPITFTYDWGMVTDLARRNIARACGKLSVENIIVAANIQKKRKNIKKNIQAWLKKPELGMIPLFMAGDKYFFYHANKVKKQLGIDLEIWGVNRLENTDFKTGFAGIPPKFDKKMIYSLSILSQLKLFSFVGRNFMQSPGYINQSMFDTLGSFFSRYSTSKKDYIHLFDYMEWKEDVVEDVIINQYDWEKAVDTDSTWRIGDGTASFYNYIYTLVAGFSENDTFRSNQIREGAITRSDALELVYKENIPRYNSLKWYLEIIDLDYESTIKRINAISRLY